MKYLYALPSGPVRPYPRQDDQPVVGVDPTAFAVLLLQQDPKPEEYNPATHHLLPRETVTLGEPEGVLHRTWELVPLSEEEKQAYRRAMNPPRWVDFAAALMANPGVKQFLGNMVTIDAAAYGGLIGGLVQASNDRPEIFLSTWMKIKKQGVIPEQLSAFVVLTASQNDLPEEFIQSLAA